MHTSKRLVSYIYKSFLFDSQIHNINPYTNVKQNVHKHQTRFERDSPFNIALVKKAYYGLGHTDIVDHSIYWVTIPSNLL